MRSMRAAEDLTTRARIRDTAIALVGQTGVAPTVRAIAVAAGVSPALVVHHFRSKDGLQQECDDHVLRQFHTISAEAGGYGTADLLAQIARKRELAPLLGYTIQALLDGRPFAKQLFDLLVDDTAGYLENGVAEGAIRPTSDERARATMLATFSLGTLVLARYATPTEDGSDAVGADPLSRLDRIQTMVAEPMLEIFTHGLFTDDRAMQAYQAYLASTGAPMATNPSDPDTHQEVSP